jgi:hypothetical protein
LKKKKHCFTYSILILYIRAREKFLMVRVDLTAGLIGAACVWAWMQLAANRIFLFQFVILKFREELSYGQAVSIQRHRPAASQFAQD